MSEWVSSCYNDIIDGLIFESLINQDKVLPAGVGVADGDVAAKLYRWQRKHQRVSQSTTHIFISGIIYDELIL